MSRNGLDRLLNVLCTPISFATLDSIRANGRREVIEYLKSICLQSAISIGYVELGKTIPIMDGEKCIECRGLQESVSDVSFHVPYKAYAVWSKELKDVICSSSSGIVAVFSRHFLTNGGVVCGTIVREGVTQHICFENLEELDLLRDSKYVQSEIGNCYCQIRSGCYKFLRHIKNEIRQIAKR